MADLTTTYLGLKLSHPVIAGAGPLAKRLDGAQRLADAGAAAIVLHSLFEEQIRHESRELDHYLNQGTGTFAEAAEYFPDLGHYNVGPEGYLKHVSAVKKGVKVPVIASLNGVSTAGWVDHARRIQEAGADALELNLYHLAADPEISGAEIERGHVELVTAIVAKVKIPVAVKVSPFFTSLPHFSRQLVKAGAKGIVLFNRFYQPDFDLETMEVHSNLKLSTSDDLRLPLRWTAIMHGKVAADLSLTGGVHRGEDAVKAIAAGAACVQVVSASLRHGADHLRRIADELGAWLTAHEYESVAQLTGSMDQRSIANPAAFERANYMKELASFMDNLR